MQEEEINDRSVGENKQAENKENTKNPASGKINKISEIKEKTRDYIKTKGLVPIISAILIILGIFFLTPLGGKTVFYLTTIGQSKNSTDSGEVSFKDPDSIGKLLKGDGTISKYAPSPEGFRNQTCTQDRKDEVKELAYNTWSIPAINTSSEFTVSGQSTGGAIVLPEAPQGTYYDYSKPIGSDEGSSLIAGHVDYTKEDKLSPYGQLHKVSPCARIYLPDTEGKIHEYAITDLYTVPQDSIESEEALWSLIGDPALYLVTCSGPSVTDTGGVFRFNYQDNLIIRAEKIS